jgi:hypothetical protein
VPSAQGRLSHALEATRPYDGQLTTVFNMAAPLASHSRQYFLEDVARSLRDPPELGDGVVARTCAEVQKRYWRAPDLSRAAGTSKYR